ncbi:MULTISPECIES: TonB-dependent receptor [unclassified Janthinobacterium]|uniref:TonB-dependent receptor n=1 Tax=unclassified Janthinobacterium TaxID=2610881 RepID=UPI001E3B48E8|nr:MULTISPECIES: TonB-dependent receptor [unclassified Janthinobacterium]MCC7641670.1 TonB-dependent receptor [Janthinobacterium sp. EB271-G4-3-1]MCC7690923.1 TonB-dependent receptor [Janthinobacterium sp. EB271-G4-3-2]
MMIENVISRSLRLMFAGGMALSMHAAYAQETTDGAMQRVEVTGSSIKRIASEASLPVQSFNQKDIKKTGVTTVTDFIQQIPAMQGFSVAADSVGGGGGGVTTASIHDIGAAYTLVLLNGRRIAPSNSGTTIDLNSIPLSAIERVEVLTDGASALYGADAIAGVVNFILKKGASPLEINAKYSRPEEKGGASNSISISKGFGDIDEDGYSIFVSASHDEQKSLKASQRSFAKSGIINFNDPKNGKALQFINGSSRSAPGNAAVDYNRTDPVTGAVVINPETNKPFVDSVNLNPYALAHGGKCAASNMDFYGNGNCYFDSPSTIEINPESKRDAIFSSGTVKLGKTGFQGFYDLAYTEARVVASIAPYPADFSVDVGSPLFNKYLAPNLTPAQLANATGAVANYRLSEMGNRVYDYGTKATHIVAGIDGNAFGWDINSAVTYSKNKQTQKYVSGFPLADKFDAQVAAGNIDPFAYPVGSMPDAMRQALLGTGFSGTYNTQTVEMKGIDGRASRPVFSLPGGTAMLGVGADFRNTSYKVKQADVARQAQILFDNAQVDSEYARDNAGAYAELMMPISKKLEMTGSLRYDQIGAIDDKLTGKTVGKKENATTWKISGKYSATKSLMFRAAAGTGFRAASMQEIAGPLEDWGVTGGNYQCPLTAANGMGGHPLASYCSGVGRQQFEAFQGGNPDLKPETSKQWSIGTVFEPIDSLSMSFDLWNVEIRDQVTAVSEGLIFNDPAKYANLFTTKHISSTGKDVLAIKLLPINIGKVENRGIDYDFTHKMKLLDGRLTSRLMGTYLLRSRYTTPGTDDQWETSLNRYGSNDKVSFRNIIRATTSYETAKFTHTLSASYRNGYTDKEQTVDDCAVIVAGSPGECYGIQLEVPSYTTFDFQTAYRPMKNVEITGGILNLFDRNPPFTLRNTGSHQVGYNPSYSSALGRQFYLSGSYKF